MTAEPLLRSDVDEIAAGLGDEAADFAGKTVLLCGGRGFLGRYFVAAFARLNETRLKKPCRLIVLDNLITADKAAARQKPPRHTRFILHDIIRPFAPKQRIDFIVQAAGIASPYYYRAYPLETLQVAIDGTRHMLELARQSGARLLFFSSSEIYGDPDPRHVPTPESYRGNVACQGPRACYDESKRLGETLCYVYHHKFGVAVNAVRPFNVYGPGMGESDYRVLPNFASRIKAGLPLKLYGSGHQTRTFCYVTDALVGFLKVLARGAPGEAYNIGNPKPEVSMAELAERVSLALGRRVPTTRVEYPDSYPPDEPQRRCPDVTKAARQLGFTPRVELDDGLRRFLRWADKAYTGETAA